MSREIQGFIRDYSKAVLDGSAAVFAGAGLSKPAGFVDWKELLREVADDLGLDIDRETDLIAVAQYHVNEHAGNRAKLNQIIIEEFTKHARAGETHHLLAGLPIRTYWTTNYDKLIEDTLSQHNKRVDVKITIPDMAHTRSHADAVVYKMHGDVSAAHDAVLTKDDYDTYNDKRQVLTAALQGDLISKTFLFIGYSLHDPNLDHVLARVKSLLGSNQRQHYCFMKRLDRASFNDTEQFQYETLKQDLRIKDLSRYGIKVLVIEDYAEIPNILGEVTRIVASQNVFISGSAHTYGSWGEERALAFAAKLSGILLQQQLNIITGFGLGIGSSVITGALEEIFLQKEDISERLHLRPFPQGITNPEKRKRIWRQYREEIMKMAGISIFMFGNNVENGTVVTANGMLEEFELGCQTGVTPIPVGATAYAAREIWTQVMGDFEKYVGKATLRPLYEKLNDETLTDDELIGTIVKIARTLARPS